MESVLEYYEGLPPTSIIKGKNSSTHRSPCYARRGPIGIKTEIKVCKSVGPDNIPNKVLKEFAPALAIVIQDIYNQSLIESHIPHAVVKMFYHFPYTKRAPPPLPTHTQSMETDLRSISLTCTLAKVMQDLFCNLSHQFSIISKSDARNNIRM